MRQVLFALAMIAVCGAATAETSRETAARLGVDVVVLRGGREARGSIVERRDDGGLSIAVRREWLQDREPEWAAELDAAVEVERRATLESLIERTRSWLDERAEDGRLCAAVELQLERLERKLKGDQRDGTDEPASDFVLVTLAADEIRHAYAQPRERKQLALVAWQSGIDRVESTPVNRLRDQLNRRQVEWRTTKADLTDRLASSVGDGEREWAARKAIYEYSLRQPLEFQGTGNFVVRTGSGGAPPNGLELLGGLLEGGLANDLSGLLQEALGDGIAAKPQKSWLDSAIAIAERDGVTGFRVTRTEQDVPRQSVSVEDRFVARMPNATWETIWLTNETRDASQPRPALESQIREDGQVSEALKLAEGLGLGGGVDTAVRFGAATMEAQQNAAGQFAEFIDRYTLRLDGPVLKWLTDQN